MARYNSPKVASTINVVENHEGGKSYKLSPRLELIGMLSTGFDNTFYESLNERELRFSNLVKEMAKTDLLFLAKAMVYARSVVGQRSITHFGSVLMAPYLSGNEIGKRYYSKRNKKAETGGIIHRLDDMLEIVACYVTLNPGKPLPASMKKGFKNAIENADTYELAKYQGKNKLISLVDVVNLVHPKPKNEMKETFKSLMSGELKQFNTVEDKNTESGKVVAEKVKKGEITKTEAEEVLKEAKTENYKELVLNRTIGYLALLRNLRNILNNSNDTELINGVIGMLTDKNLIKKALIFPHQIDLAFEVLLSELGASHSGLNKILVALNTAYELAIPNLTELFPHGRTAVVFDSSGSMSDKIQLATRKQGSDSAIGKAALIAATLGKGIGADVFHFASTCEQIKYNPIDSINTIKKLFVSKQGSVGHGTEFNSIITKLKDNYDRVFIISDMQGNSRLTQSDYKNKHIYNIDIVGYGTTMFKPGEKRYQLFGYSSEIYELIKKVEVDPKALINAIEAIVI
jgi:polyhydroxyalkanoate synthesis regulator phasin